MSTPPRKPGFRNLPPIPRTKPPDRVARHGVADLGPKPIGTLTDFSDQALGELNQHIADQPVDARRITGLPTPITGRVASAGTIDSGTGFAITKTGTGTYTITFDVPYAAVPLTVCTGVHATAGRNVTITLADETQTQVRTATLGDVATDAAFYFAVFATN